jgi:hypothetical protein
VGEEEMKRRDTVDDKQLAICKQRGHKNYLKDKWTQCKWCGMWLREVRKVEESRKTPPEGEWDESMRLDKQLGELNEQIKQRLKREREK